MIRASDPPRDGLQGESGIGRRARDPSLLGLRSGGGFGHCQRRSAALTSFRPSGLAHSAGPASEAISQPLGSTRTVVARPIALPAGLGSWHTLKLASE